MMDLTFFGLVPMLFGGAPADTPQALLDSIYQPLVAGEQTNLEEHYSDRLRDLVASNVELNELDANGELIDPNAPPIVEFNPFLNGRLNDITNLAVSEPAMTGSTAVALVRFDTPEEATVLTVSMILEQGEWKVDDIASLGQGEKWLYSWLLHYDPFSEQ